MTKHSILGASGAERWMHCPGSVSLLKHVGVAEESDEPGYRAEGTAAHEMAAKALREGLEAWELAGEKASNGVPVSREMMDAIEVYLTTCRKLMTQQVKIHLEEFLSGNHPQMFGTVDFATVSDSLLNIVDYKHGEGILVEVEENPQLKYYAYLVLLQNPGVRRVVLRVVQPRASHPMGTVRRWETTAEAICAWVEDTLLPAMQRAATDHTLEAGPWCRFCPAKLVCPLLGSLFETACTYDAKAIPNLSDDSLGHSYRLADAARMYIKAIGEEVYQRLMKGNAIPGAKLVNKKADRTYKDGAEAIFKGAFGEEAYTAPELKSPAQMEKLGDRAKKLVKEFAYVPNTGFTVASADDKRQEVRPTSLAERFAGYKG